MHRQSCTGSRAQAIVHRQSCTGNRSQDCFHPFYHVLIIDTRPSVPVQCVWALLSDMQAPSRHSSRSENSIRAPGSDYAAYVPLSPDNQTTGRAKPDLSLRRHRANQICGKGIRSYSELHVGTPSLLDGKQRQWSYILQSCSAAGRFPEVLVSSSICLQRNHQWA